MLKLKFCALFYVGSLKARGGDWTTSDELLAQRQLCYHSNSPSVREDLHSVRCPGQRRRCGPGSGLTVLLSGQVGWRLDVNQGHEQEFFWISFSFIRHIYPSRITLTSVLPQCCFTCTQEEAGLNLAQRSSLCFRLTCF